MCKVGPGRSQEATSVMEVASATRARTLLLTGVLSVAAGPATAAPAPSNSGPVPPGPGHP